jgi:hypothetical protein
MKLRLTPEELAKAHDGLCSSSIGDGPCSCLVHWIEGLQTEADKLKLEKRGFQIMTRKVADAMAAPLKQLVLDGKYERAGGDVECEICRLKYFEHPQVPDLPTFHLICSGSVVKT